MNTTHLNLIDEESLYYKLHCAVFSKSIFGRIKSINIAHSHIISSGVKTK